MSTGLSKPFAFLLILVLVATLVSGLLVQRVQAVRDRSVRLSPTPPITSVDLSTYVRVGRFDLPEPTRTAHPPNSLLAQEASAVTYNWDSPNAFVDLRAGSLSTINFPSIGAGACADAYFEVTVVRNASAYNTTRRYHITANDFSGTVSTPTPRELFVEHLISQNRNSISDVKYGPVGGPYTSVAPGGSMALVVGNTYDIQLFGGTATQAKGFSGRPVLEEIERWRAAQGRLDILQFSLTKGGNRIEAKGELTLDELHRPAGQLQIAAAGLDRQRLFADVDHQRRHASVHVLDRLGSAAGRIHAQFIDR